MLFVLNVVIILVFGIILGAIVITLVIIFIDCLINGLWFYYVYIFIQLQTKLMGEGV